MLVNAWRLWISVFALGFYPPVVNFVSAHWLVLSCVWVWGACGRVSLVGCERLAMGPAGATPQVLLVRRGRVAGSAGQVWSTASVG